MWFAPFFNFHIYFIFLKITVASSILSLFTIYVVFSVLLLWLELIFHKLFFSPCFICYVLHQFFLLFCATYQFLASSSICPSQGVFRLNWRARKFPLRTKFSEFWLLNDISFFTLLQTVILYSYILFYVLYGWIQLLVCDIEVQKTKQWLLMRWRRMFGLPLWLVGWNLLSTNIIHYLKQQRHTDSWRVVIILGRYSLFPECYKCSSCSRFDVFVFLHFVLC